MESNTEYKRRGAPEQDVAVVTSKAGAVEELALRRHPLHHIDLFGAEETVVAPAAARGLGGRGPDGTALPPQLWLGGRLQLVTQLSHKGRHLGQRKMITQHREL